jgi:hypothetical protein
MCVSTGSTGRDAETARRLLDNGAQPEMKQLLIVACACLFLAACARPASGKEADDLRVAVTLTTGEHSKDSGSQTTTITAERNAIVWEKTSGGRGRETPPVRKSFRLSPADKGSLLKLIRSNNLLVTNSIELPRDGSNVRYFELSADLSLDGKKGAIQISGLRTAVTLREEKLYRHILTLVRELYRIMNSQDKRVLFEELIGLQ